MADGRLIARKRSRQMFVAGIMLVAFALRALVPPGFMPANDRPFSFEICWEDLPAAMLAQGGAPHADSTGVHSVGMESMLARSTAAGSTHSHPHHSGRPSHSEHCVFGTACSAGPIPHPPLPIEISSAQRLRAVPFLSVAGAVRLVHLPQSRAPPGRLS